MRALFYDAELAHQVSPAFDELDIPAGQDTREWATRAIAQRRGQRSFRNALLAGYGRQCVITQCSVDGVLEAAHISPYRGSETNDPRNGLLLRSDIHTLFDLNLVTVVPGLTIRIAPDLRGTPYGSFEGNSAFIAREATLQPDPTMLARHNRACPWLTG